MDMDMDMKNFSFEFYQSIKKRRSVRKFKPDPIDIDIIKNAIRSAGTAPSGANRQPWHFVVVTDVDIKNKIRKESERVEEIFYKSENNKDWVGDLKFLNTNSKKEYLSEAPVLIVIFTRTKLENIPVNHVTRKAYYPKESAGIATGILITALHQSGLSTLTHTPQPMQFLNQLFKLDKSFVPYLILVAGHKAENYEPLDVPKKELSQFADFY